MGRITLPRPGQRLEQVFISPLAVPLDRPDLLVQLLCGLGEPAEALGAKMLTLSLDARDPRLPILIGSFRPRLFHTKLYTVTWPDRPRQCDALDGRLLYPEVALL